MLPLLDPSVPLTRVYEHVRMRWRQNQRVELELSLGLRRLFRDQIHRGTGHGNFASYAQAEFDMPPKLVWTFSNLGEHLERLPLLVEAMASAEVTWTKAREFAPYIDPEDQENWIEFARLHTNREVEQRVGRWNAARKGEEYVEKKKVTSKLNGLETQALRQAREKLLKSTGEFVSEEKTLAAMAKLFVEGKLNTVGGEAVGGEPGASGDAGDAGKAPRSVTPYLTVNACPGCLTTFVPVPGANMPVAAFEFIDRLRLGGEAGASGQWVNLVRHYFCDCKNAMHRRDECPEKEPHLEVPKEAVSRYVPADVRRLIEARDGFRCRVPGCLNQLPLEGGHIHPFAENGPPTAGNVATQCQACNALIREGRLRVAGVAPFEKYYREDGTFLGFGFNPMPFRAGSTGPSRGSDSSGVSHVGQDDEDDRKAGGAGKVSESPPIWGHIAVP